MLLVTDHRGRITDRVNTPSQLLAVCRRLLEVRIVHVRVRGFLGDKLMHGVYDAEVLSRILEKERSNENPR